MTVNVAPVAHFSWACSVTKGGRVCKFNGSASRDDVRVTNWSWSFGDGRNGTGASLSNSFAAARSYTVQLTVRDTGGTTASVRCTVQTGTKGNC
jgi:PKD repeat protein